MATHDFYEGACSSSAKLRLCAMRTQAFSFDPMAYLRTALSWWLAELRSLLPWRLRQAVASELMTVLVEGGANGWHIRTQKLGALAQASAVAEPDAVVASWDEARSRIVARARRFGPLGAVRLRIPIDRCLKRTVLVPTAERTRVRAIGLIDLERTTPFKLDSVYVGHGVFAEAESQDGLREISQVISKRANIDPMLSDLRQAGVHVAAVEVLGSTGVLRGIDLLEGQPNRRRPVEKIAEWTLAGLSGAVVVLILTATAMTLHRQGAQLAELERQLQQSRQEAARLRQQETQLSDRLSQLRSPVLERISTTSALDIWLDLTKRLGDDTWLDMLSIAPETIDLIGTSSAASELIAILSRSPLAQEVSFSAPVTRESLAARERFQIRIKRRLAADSGARSIPNGRNVR